MRLPPVARHQHRHIRTALTAGRGSTKARGRSFSSGRPLREESGDPRAPDAERQTPSYETPKYPIVLAHGLFGFSELTLNNPFIFTPSPSSSSSSSPPSPPLFRLQYWRGIKEALADNGARVITTTVPPAAPIAARAKELRAAIAAGLEALPPRSPSVNDGSVSEPTAAAVAAAATAATTHEEKRPRPPVNIIAHSMGGLDARYMISRLLNSPDAPFAVASLVTIGTPHRGSPVAAHLHRYYPFLPLSIRTALADLTPAYAAAHLTPAALPDDPSVRYFSYAAAMRPAALSTLSLTHPFVSAAEGLNDGLVSVASSRWGRYVATLDGVSHLDLINWQNRLEWRARELVGLKRTFNAIAFYLGVADMLAKEGF